MEGVKLHGAKDIAALRETLLRAQGQRCLLCDLDFREMKVKGRKRVPIANPVLDHCHESGFVRGVICNTCNGMYGEGKVRQAAKACSRKLTETEWLMRLAAYWELHQEPQTRYIHPKHKTADEKRIERNLKERLRRAKIKAATGAKV